MRKVWAVGGSGPGPTFVHRQSTAGEDVLDHFDSGRMECKLMIPKEKRISSTEDGEVIITIVFIQNR